MYGVELLIASIFTLVSLYIHIMNLQFMLYVCAFAIIVVIYCFIKNIWISWSMNICW